MITIPIIIEHLAETYQIKLVYVSGEKAINVKTFDYDALITLYDTILVIRKPTTKICLIDLQKTDSIQKLHDHLEKIATLKIDDKCDRGIPNRAWL